MEPLFEKYPAIQKGSVISAVDLINGIGHYAGLRRIAVEGATGLYNTNYENKVAAALEALKTDDFVYLHIEASDEAGHEGDFKLKQFTIENLDKRAVGPIYEAVKDWDEPVAHRRASGSSYALRTPYPYGRTCAFPYLLSRYRTGLCADL